MSWHPERRVRLERAVRAARRPLARDHRLDSGRGASARRTAAPRVPPAASEVPRLRERFFEVCFGGLPFAAASGCHPPQGRDQPEVPRSHHAAGRTGERRHRRVQLCHLVPLAEQPEGFHRCRGQVPGPCRRGTVRRMGNCGRARSIRSSVIVPMAEVGVDEEQPSELPSERAAALEVGRRARTPRAHRSSRRARTRPVPNACVADGLPATETPCRAPRSSA